MRRAVAALLLAASAAVPAPAARAQEAEPVVDVTPREVHVGDEVRLTGSGCAGQVVSTFGDPADTPFHGPVPAADDGTFSALATAAQPHFHGDRGLIVRCTEDGQVVWEEGVPLLLVGEPFQPLDGDVEIGRPHRMIAPCDADAFRVEHLPLFRASTYGMAHLGPVGAGTVVTVPTEAGLPPGSYLVRATCETAGRTTAEYSLTIRFVTASAAPGQRTVQVLPETT